MKKKLVPMILILALAAFILSGCSAKSYMANNAPAKDEALSSEAFYDVAWDYDLEENGFYSNASAPMYEPGSADYPMESDIADIIAAAANTSQSDGKMMIYTAYADMETLTFDDTVQEVYAMLDRFGAYIESSSVTGTDYATTYYGNRSYRNANFAIRVPVQNYSNMSASLTELGNVTSYSSSSENITTRYTDTESRLKAYRTEYDRLIEMLAAADNVYDMITVEQRLSEVEYNIETLTSTLRGMDDQVKYSTINLYVREVYEFTEPKVEHQSFGSEIVETLKDSVEWLVNALRAAVVFIIAALPWLVLPAVIVVVIIVAVKMKRAKKRKLAAENRQDEGKDLQ